MNKADAVDISRDMAQPLAEGHEEFAKTFGRIQGAIFDQAYEFIPSNAVVALVERDSEPWTLVALDGQQLYFLTVSEIEDGLLAQPPTKCRMLHVEPGVGSVEMETKFHHRHGPRGTRDTVWRFQLGGVDLTIETHFDPERARVEDGEVLAQALAKALGWSLPDLESGQLASAA